jgi:hypothetical protein
MRQFKRSLPHTARRCELSESKQPEKQLEAISVGAATDIRMVNGHCVSSADILKNKTRVRD